MTDAPPHSDSTGTWRVLGITAFVFFIALVLWIGSERGAAEREYAAYERLCAMGATGDDWVSFREIVTGRPPVVQIDIPSNIPPHTALHALPDLHNLEALTLAYATLNADQIETLQGLKLQSLRFRGGFPRDADIPGLASLRSLRFLYVPSTNLSVDGQSRLRALLPSTQIRFQ